MDLTDRFRRERPGKTALLKLKPAFEFNVIRCPTVLNRYRTEGFQPVAEDVSRKQEYYREASERRRDHGVVACLSKVYVSKHTCCCPRKRIEHMILSSPMWELK